MIAGFLILASITFILDQRTGTGGSMRWGGLFSDAQAARNFLGVIASSIITVTSITLSLLLIAVQQGAASLSSLVFDQFLRRRTNQLYFGFFIGLALYALIVLASINPAHQPIYGVALAGILTVIALYLLILLTYTTINQMRPVVIIKSIHDHTLRARDRQLDLLQTSRRLPLLPANFVHRLRANRSGFMTTVDITAIDNVLTDDTEVVLMVSIGDYVAYQDVIAEIRTLGRAAEPSLLEAIDQALFLEEQRDLDTDPAFGIEQLVTIGWTSISTAKSNPDPGLLTIWHLRDLLARWLSTGESAQMESDNAGKSRVVYHDNVLNRLLQAFESLAIVASESMQHQSAAQVYLTFATLFGRLPPEMQQQAEDLLLRSVAGLGDQILSHDLNASLSVLIEALNACGRNDCAAAIEIAQDRLAKSVGVLNSRSTRTSPRENHLP